MRNLKSGETALPNGKMLSLLTAVIALPCF